MRYGSSETPACRGSGPRQLAAALSGRRWLERRAPVGETRGAAHSNGDRRPKRWRRTPRYADAWLRRRAKSASSPDACSSGDWTHAVKGEQTSWRLRHDFSLPSTTGRMLSTPGFAQSRASAAAARHDCFHSPAASRRAGIGDAPIAADKRCELRGRDLGLGATEPSVHRQTGTSCTPLRAPWFRRQQGPPASADACIHDRAIGAGVVRLGAERPGAVGSSPGDTCAGSARPTRHRRVSNARSTTCRSRRGRWFAPEATTPDLGSRSMLSVKCLQTRCKHDRALGRVPIGRNRAGVNEPTIGFTFYDEGPLSCPHPDGVILLTKSRCGE